MLVIRSEENVIMEDHIVEKFSNSEKKFLHISEEQNKFIEDRLKQCPLTQLQMKLNLIPAN